MDANNYMTGLLHSQNPHGILLLLAGGLSPLLPELFEGISPPVLAFEFVAGEDDCPFRL